MGEARKRLGILGVLVEQRGRLAWGGADCGSIACPFLIQEATQPQEDDQQEVMDKEVVYHNVSLLLGEIDDRLPGSQAGALSARRRYTTEERVIGSGAVPVLGEELQHMAHPGLRPADRIARDTEPLRQRVGGLEADAVNIQG